MPTKKSKTSALRPSIWIGHIYAKVKDPQASLAFYKALGLREVWGMKGMAILELRGGTHLLLFGKGSRSKGIPKEDFDLMVEDVRKTHRKAKKDGLRVSAIKKDPYHLYFDARTPDGNRIRVNSDHTYGRSV